MERVLLFEGSFIDIQILQATLEEEGIVSYLSHNRLSSSLNTNTIVKMWIDQADEQRATSILNDMQGGKEEIIEEIEQDEIEENEKKIERNRELFEERILLSSSIRATFVFTKLVIPILLLIGLTILLYYLIFIKHIFSGGYSIRVRGFAGVLAFIVPIIISFKLFFSSLDTPKSQIFIDNNGIYVKLKESEELIEIKREELLSIQVFESDSAITINYETGDEEEPEESLTFFLNRELEFDEIEDKLNRYPFK